MASFLLKLELIKSTAKYTEHPNIPLAVIDDNPPISQGRPFLKNLSGDTLSIKNISSLK